MPDKRKIVIVGAGPSGLSAAFHLTDPHYNPGWQDRYEVDVYQMGWRVGGKGATGRNPDAGERIQEHGIHVFGNMYFNSFDMVKRAYAEVDWDTHDRFTQVEEAFKPCVLNYNTDYWNGRWQGWIGRFPDDDAVPWDGENWPDVRLVVQSLLTIIDFHLGAWLTPEPKPHGALAVLRWWLRKLRGDAVTKALGWVGEHLVAEAADPRPPDPGHHGILLEALEALVKLLEARYLADPDDVNKRSLLLTVDLSVTFLRGIIDDRLVANGVDSVDGENYREWLERHGATETLLHSSVPQIFPNVALSYADGDTTAIPTMAASAYVTFFVRQLLGRGAGGYFFAEGTGETIMKPLYRLLVQRGVRFHFFHKLTEVVPDGGSIASLTFDVQVGVDGTYDPLRRTPDGELVWPDRPLYDRIVDGHRLEESGADLESWWTSWEPKGPLVLRAGEDFDTVILATPIATLEHTCPKLMADPVNGQAWTDMIRHGGTSASQAVQLWLNEPTDALGWDAPKYLPTDRYVGPLYMQDLTSFCDFSDLIEQERWPEGQAPRGLIYLIGNLADPDEIPGFDDHGYPEREFERVKWATVQWLRSIDGLLPKAVRSPVDPRSLDFDLLFQHDPSTNSVGVNRFAQQYWKANIDPNERYTLSVPGTLTYRKEAWDSGFDNLVLAGDWIYTGFNIGSFEGAVMGGKLASLAVSGSPTIEQIPGYTFMHPDRNGPPTPVDG